MTQTILALAHDLCRYPPFAGLTDPLCLLLTIQPFRRLRNIQKFVTLILLGDNLIFVRARDADGTGKFHLQ